MTAYISLSITYPPLAQTCSLCWEKIARTASYLLLARAFCSCPC